MWKVRGTSTAGSSDGGRGVNPFGAKSMRERPRRRSPGPAGCGPGRTSDAYSSGTRSVVWRAAQGHRGSIARGARVDACMACVNGGSGGAYSNEAAERS